MPVKEHESTLPGSGLVDVCYFTARPQGYAGWSRSPQVDAEACPPAE